MGGKAPDSPDYRGAAEEAGESSREVTRDQTFANRPEQYTPWGFTNWDPYQDVDPSSGEDVTRWRQTTGLTDELQDILNKQIGVQGARSQTALDLTNRMAGEFNAPINWEGLSGMGEVPYEQFTRPEGVQRGLDYGGVSQIGDPYQTRQRAEDAVYGQAESRLSPRFEQQRQAMEVKLRNQGLGPEDQAYKAQMSAIDQQETDAYNQAQFSAVGAGREESGQMFGQQLARRQQGVGEVGAQGTFFNQAAQQSFGQNLAANQQNYGQAMESSKYANQIRQQQITEALTRRGSSLNEIQAILQGQQVNLPQMPNFSTASRAAPVNYLGAANMQGEADLNAFNASQAAIQGYMGGATSLAGLG